MERTCFELGCVLILSFASSLGDLTSSGWVVSGHLSEVGMVLYYISILISFGLHLRPSFPYSTGLDFERVQGVDIRFARKNSPEMLRASQRTTTIFWPFKSCLATVLASRPSKCPLPSMTIYREKLISYRYPKAQTPSLIPMDWNG
jgi:hypothetical protein